MSIEKDPGPEVSKQPPELHEAEGQITYAAESIVSETHPERNEDSYFALPEHETFGVFDGMSIPPGGEIASRLARDAVKKKIAELPHDAAVNSISEHMQEAFAHADEKIMDYARQQPQYKGIGTTASVLKIARGEHGKETAVIGHVGDSRVYLLRHHKLACLTIDDTLPMAIAINRKEAQKLQKRLSEVLDRGELSVEERGLFERQNELTKSLGSGDRPSIATFKTMPGDVFIITSDGIHDNLTDSEIEKIVAGASSPDAAARELAEAALARSHEKDSSGEKPHLRAKKDDMTAVVARL